MKHLMTVTMCCGLLLSAHCQTWNPDADFNNVIGLNDLLALLTVYGNEWTVDAGEDAEFDIAAYYAGEMDLMQCITTCRSNNAAIMSVEEYALFRDSVDLAMGYDEVNNACSFCSSSYCSASFVRQAYCRNNSDFGYGIISRGATFNCSWSSISSGDVDAINLYPITSAGDRHCVCSGLVPFSRVRKGLCSQT